MSKKKKKPMKKRCSQVEQSTCRTGVQQERMKKNPGKKIRPVQQKKRKRGSLWEANGGKKGGGVPMTSALWGNIGKGNRRKKEAPLKNSDSREQGLFFKKRGGAIVRDLPSLNGTREKFEGEGSTKGVIEKRPREKVKKQARVSDLNNKRGGEKNL